MTATLLRQRIARGEVEKAHLDRDFARQHMEILNALADRMPGAVSRQELLAARRDAGKAYFDADQAEARLELAMMENS